MLGLREPRRARSSNGFSVTKITPVLGALVKVAPSKPTNATACCTPGRRQDHLGRLADHARRCARACAPGGKLERRDQIAAVELRDQAGRRRRQPVVGQA